jgi:putative transposase
MSTLRSELPDLKEWWDDLNDVYSRTLQVVVERLYDNLESLSALKENGYNVGSLQWKSPAEYRSFTYSQSGFELDKKSGRTVLSLSKIGDVPLVFHRNLPEDAQVKQVKQVTLKKERTGEWFVTFGIETPDEPPEKPDDPEKVVGIDVGILKYVHDTDDLAVGSLDLSYERDRLEREQRKLSRKEHGSVNWEQQRRAVARCHARIKRRRDDFLHKLSRYYAENYDLIAIEDLNIKSMLEGARNSRDTASSAWHRFRRLLAYKCERAGTHLVAVDPAGTTKECSQCNAETDKPLWVREHSCPACGHTEDRDANAARNVLSRGLNDVGVVHSESTPSETAIPAPTAVVGANRVMEQGSSALNEASAQARAE